MCCGSVNYNAIVQAKSDEDKMRVYYHGLELFFRNGLVLLMSVKNNVVELQVISLEEQYVMISMLGFRKSSGVVECII